MSTDTTTIPAWLNMDAFDLPAEHLDLVRTTGDELQTIVQRLGELLEPYIVADQALEAANTGHYSDDVSEALMEVTGRQRVWDLLTIMATWVGEVTGSGGFQTTSYLEAACNRCGITASVKVDLDVVEVAK